MSTKRGMKRTRKGDPVERHLKAVDRAVARYGPSAVAKYYTPRSVFKPEMKYFDTMFDQNITGGIGNWTSAVIACTSYMSADGSTVSAYSYAALIPSATGTGYGQVQGSKYILRKLRIRADLAGVITSGATTVGNPNYFRVMLVQDTQPSGVQGTADQFMTDWGSDSQSIESFQSVTTSSGSRFRILYDKTIVMDPIASVNNAAAGSVSFQMRSQRLRITKSWKKGLEVILRPNAATNNVANLNNANIFLVAKSTSGQTVNFRGCARAIFQD